MTSKVAPPSQPARSAGGRVGPPPNLTADTAVEIYQDFLDQIGAAIETGSFEWYSRHILLPHGFQTAEASGQIETLDTLKDYFDRLVDHPDKLGVTGLTRYCTVAESSSIPKRYADAMKPS